MQKRRGIFYNECLVLLRPFESGQKHETSWQAHFPRLDVLSVIFEVDQCLGYCEKMRAHIRDLPQHSTIDIRPRKVEMDMNYPNCVFCGTKVGIILVDTIRSMVKLRSDS